VPPWLGPLAAALVIAATMVTVASLLRSAERVDQARFERLSDKLVEELRRRLEACRFGLLATRSSFTISQDVTRAEFRTMVEERAFNEEFPAALGLGYARLVDRSHLGEFVSAMRNDDAPQFEVQSRHHDDLMMVVQFIEPAISNPHRIGSDLGDDPRTRAAADAAARSGNAVLTEHKQLRLMDGSSVDGFHYLLPIYRRGSTHESEDARRAAVEGWVFMPIVESRLFGAADAIVDGEARFVHSISAEQPSSFRRTIALMVGGRSWDLVVEATDRFRTASRANAWLTGLCGACTAFAIGMLARVQSTAVRRAETMATRMTSDLRRLALVAEKTTNAVVVTDAEHRVVWVNEGFVRIVGWSADEVVGRPQNHVLTSSDADRATIEELRAAMDAGRGHRAEIRASTKSGTTIWLDVDIQPIHDEAGRVAGFIAIESDITEQVEARERLARSEERYRVLVEGTEVIAWEFDPQADRFTYVSPKAVRLGYPLETWYEPGFWARTLHPDDRDRAIAFCRDETLAGHAHRLQYRMIAADGTEVLIDDVVSTPERTATGILLRGVMVDVSERARIERRLSASETFVERAGELAGIGGWELDVGTHQLRWTNQTSRIHGVPVAHVPTVEEAIGYYAPEARPIIASLVERAIATGEGFDVELPFITADGRDIWVRAIGSAETSEGRVVRLLGAFQDITERRLSEESMRRANEELHAATERANAMAIAADAASRAKSEFLANMSHEIRTPMTAILGYADLLAEGCGMHPGDAQRLDCIETIKRNGEHLLSIINDILDLSKIEAGKVQIERLCMDPRAVLRETLELMQVKAQAKGLSLRLECDEHLPDAIECDPMRLKQILVNLVGNAIKFTELGSVSVSAHCEPDPAAACDGDRLHLVITVADTGVGMAPGQLERLFGAFEQADASTTRRFGGTGLGLMISRRLAHLLGGDISVSSELGRGSTFTLRLAAVRSDPAALDDRRVEVDRVSEAQALAAESRAVLAGVRILLAEDGPDNRRLIAFHLRKAGAQIVSAEDGVRALEHATLDGTADGPLADPPRFDVVITDMQMPRMDGYTLARTLRARGWQGPIIALTAHAMNGDAERCFAAGCDGYASKPIDRSVLIAHCVRAIRARRTNADRRAA
jgi:PAS domain S-box-containing protein